MKKHSPKTSLRLSAEIIRTLSASELVAAHGAADVNVSKNVDGKAQPMCSVGNCTNGCMLMPPD